MLSHGLKSHTDCVLGGTLQVCSEGQALTIHTVGWCLGRAGDQQPLLVALEEFLGDESQSPVCFIYEVQP